MLHEDVLGLGVDVYAWGHNETGGDVPVFAEVASAVYGETGGKGFSPATPTFFSSLRDEGNVDDVCGDSYFVTDDQHSVGGFSFDFFVSTQGVAFGSADPAFENCFLVEINYISVLAMRKDDAA